jgi:glyoxylase-like metal-dependent hydrolase (beta-lactamase superfamily II)
VIIDANQALGPLRERAERERITVTRVLLTHHHDDHVDGIAEAAQGSAPPSSRATRRRRTSRPGWSVA